MLAKPGCSPSVSDPERWTSLMLVVRLFSVGFFLTGLWAALLLAFAWLLLLYPEDGRFPTMPTLKEVATYLAIAVSPMGLVILAAIAKARTSNPVAPPRKPS
jgi:hypothetical protein